MPSNNRRLRRHAETIWKAGLAAVDSERLVRGVVNAGENELFVCGHPIDLAGTGRIAVVGAGKAGAGMAAGFEASVGTHILREKVFGWVNVPADCVRPLSKIHLHAARPAGVNEPTEQGVAGASKILEILGALGPQDVCVVLISGGGSALLPAPVKGISLQDKQQVTRLLMHAGATIEELNCVRKQLSRTKGGRLARATTAGLMIALIISDVIGDRLDVIASGPTVSDTTTAADALDVLGKYAAGKDSLPSAVVSYLQRAAREPSQIEPPCAAVFNHVIGNNATALNAAADRARQLGYNLHSLGSANAGIARETGRELARLCLSVRDRGEPLSAPACLISGGEPVVHLVRSRQPRKGGRNQEVALGALQELWDDGSQNIVVLSGGTDGEDGPTDAAGGVADAGVLKAARDRQLLPDDFLAVNNAYPFLEQTGGLLKTGPTHTNTMDLRVALIGG